MKDIKDITENTITAPSGAASTPTPATPIEPLPTKVQPILTQPPTPKNEKYYFDSFANGEVLENKKTGLLPAMGWNSWNAFGSNNTEELTKIMADSMVELGLHNLGYKYVILDDGCYCPTRVDGRLKNEPVKFPNDFKVLSDYIHSKGLKFGMYNDIGTNLCAGAAVGTCVHEKEDAQSYVNWGVDFLKVDNCYYPWDNATFSDASNARFVYTPKIRKIMLTNTDGFELELPVTIDNIRLVNIIAKNKDTISYEQIRNITDFTEISTDSEGYVTGVGTYDGTGPEHTPVGPQSMEYHIEVEVPVSGEYELGIDYIAGAEVGCGAFLQVQSNQNTKPIYDAFVSDKPIKIVLNQGKNIIRLMNHRRQENTLLSYAKLLEELNKAKPDNDIVLSICEWGKTQPQNWGYKVGHSWRILNDITFQVGSDGNPGTGAWESDYTTSVTAQYNKAVIMDEFSGLGKGYNDPDMLMIGMNGLTTTMNRTHMTMWCMLNAPLMLGLDLRRVTRGDELYQIIANKALIELNQDPLGIQAKRVKIYMDDRIVGCNKHSESDSYEYKDILNLADKMYVRDNNRIDILCKPLRDNSIAISFINLSQKDMRGEYSISTDEISEAFSNIWINYVNRAQTKNNSFIQNIIATNKDTKTNSYNVTNLWTGESHINTTGEFTATELKACDNLTIKVTTIC